MIDLEKEVLKLKEECAQFKLTASAELFELRKNQSSRRGLDGARGEKGDSITGPAGRDAVIKIIQADGKVKVVDPNGTVHAEIVSVPGPKGDSVTGPAGAASTVPGPEGRPGRDGVSPNLEEIVAKVVKQIGVRLA